MVNIFDDSKKFGDEQPVRQNDATNRLFCRDFREQGVFKSILKMRKARDSNHRPPKVVVRRGLPESLPTSVQKSYFMLSDTERDVLNHALGKYRPSQSEPILLGGEKLLKPALRLTNVFRLRIDEIKGGRISDQLHPMAGVRPSEGSGKSGSLRWDQGLTAAEMKRCHWVKPVLVCQIKFTEWTRDDRLRQPVFLGIREDKSAAEVVREKAS